MMAIYSLENPLFKGFAFYTAAVIVKMFAVVFWTIQFRMRKGVFSNPEDVKAQGLHKKGIKPILNDDDVERARRNHLNDMENIVPFVLLGLVYVGCNPSHWLALWHFRAFFLSRVCHTITYLFAIPQPSRALSFLVGMVVNISMAAQIIQATL